MAKYFTLSVTILCVCANASFGQPSGGSAKQPSSRPLEPRIINGVGMKLVLIPSGSFEMGSYDSADDLALEGIAVPDGCDLNHESPKHRVEISRPFYLGQYEVTRGQFGLFVTESGYKTEAERDGRGASGYNPEKSWGSEYKLDNSWRKTGFVQTDDHPVVNVSWNDAVEYCKWLSQKEGRHYRLPTEAEWEYACRAGTQTQYSTGDTPSTLKGFGNFKDRAFEKKFPIANHENYPSFQFDDGISFTAAVGNFQPNQFDLYDMHGNVWEWCSDTYDEQYYGKRAKIDPTGPSEQGLLRVHRGGSLSSTPVRVRSAYRARYTPDSRAFDIGFRLVLQIDTK